MISPVSIEEINEYSARVRKENLDEYEKSKVGEILKDFKGEEGYYWAENNYPNYPNISDFFPFLLEELDQNLRDNIPFFDQGLISIETFNTRLFSIKSKKEPDNPLKLNSLHICQIASQLMSFSKQEIPDSHTLEDLVEFFNNNEPTKHYCSSILRAMIISQYYGITEYFENTFGYFFDREEMQFFKFNQEHEVANKSQSLKSDEIDW